MIEETAIVTRVGPDAIWVESSKNSGCATCAKREGCGQKLWASLGARQKSALKVPNPSQLPLAIGDSVTLGLAEGAFFKMALITYMAPLAGLILTAALAALLALPESYMIALSLTGFALGWLAGSVISKRQAHRPFYQPFLIGIKPNG